VRAAASSGVRLAELVAIISLGTDLGLGQSMEHILRQTLVSLRMAELLALDEAEREVAYFSGLLAWVGCHTDAYEQAKWFGDDIALKREGYHYDLGRPVDVLNFAWHTVGRGRSPLERLKIWLELPLAVRRNAMVDLRNHWLAADELAGRLGLGEPVRRSLREASSVGTAGGSAVRGARIRLTGLARCIVTADINPQRRFGGRSSEFLLEPGLFLHRASLVGCRSSGISGGGGRVHGCVRRIAGVEHCHDRDHHTDQRCPRLEIHARTSK
jgi:hypothetical protein